MLKHVIVRGHGDTVYVRALLGIEGRVAFVCNPDDWEREVAEERMEPLTFGFPLEDVFEWTREAAVSKCPWKEARSLAQSLGPERLERSIRGARTRRNRRRPTE